MSKPNGYILYEGPSGLDGKPIVVIATGFVNPSKNEKTGEMIQTYIIRSDMEPIIASKTMEDKSICGDCKHRGIFGAGRTCYVNLGQAPTAIYKAYKNGKYPILSYEDWSTTFKGQSVRLGSYGDPSAIPMVVLAYIRLHAKNYTSYTHFWKNNPGLKLYCMASVDTEAEYKEAKKLGWRTFRVKNETEPKLDTEVICPAVDKPGIIQCKTCKLCNGFSHAKDVTLNIHGAKWKIDNFKSLGR